jgi:hypothetical protein
MFLQWILLLSLVISECNAGYEAINSIFDKSNSIRVKHFAEGELCDGGSAHHTGWVDIKDRHLFFCTLSQRLTRSMLTAFTRVSRSTQNRRQPAAIDMASRRSRRLISRRLPRGKWTLLCE